MLNTIRRIWRKFFSKSRKINNEPLNRVSLIVIVLIDIFILVNVFNGLGDIAAWYLSPSQGYPCYEQWQNYRNQKSENRDYQTMTETLSYYDHQPNLEQIYREAQNNHLGQVSTTCLQYAQYQDQVNTNENRKIIKDIEQKKEQVNKLEAANVKIRSQYDSGLLEKIAGQNPEQSINSVAPEKAKQELQQNNRRIAELKKQISALENQLVTKPESRKFLNFLKDKNQFQQLENNYQQATSWYPTIQTGFQFLFLIPLIVLALSVHKLAERREYGLVSLISWHLLVIFFIPLIIKVFEFLQVGIILEKIINVIRAILGGLLFLVNYIYIILIPLVGFGIIQLFQKVILNTKLQAVRRVQQSRCINCAKKIRHYDAHCPHCGYYQYTECPNCHNLTYKYLPHCHHCGSPQDVSQSVES